MVGLGGFPRLSEKACIAGRGLGGMHFKYIHRLGILSIGSQAGQQISVALLCLLPRAPLLDLPPAACFAAGTPHRVSWEPRVVDNLLHRGS